MNRPSRFATRLIVPILLAVALLAAGQVVTAAPPLASFDAVGPAGNECGVWTFTSTSTDPDNDIQTYAWNLDGIDATGTPVQRTFNTAGGHSISLTVTDAAGGDDTNEDSATANGNITVNNTGLPNAAISGTTTTAAPNQAVQFSAAASTDVSPGTITNYSWDLDENGTYETSTGTTPTTTASFATSGAHTVGVQVTDNCSATDTATANLTVTNAAPTASFTAAPNPADINEEIAFDASASADPGGTIASYEWSWDGDAVFEDTTTTATTTHAYATGGTKLVRLRVTDNDGGQTTAFETVRVNLLPVPSFSFSPADPLIGQPVDFTASAPDLDGTIATYEWDLDGNGSYETTGATATTEHTYAGAGTFNVKLRVTDNDGGVAEVTRAVIVQATKPTADFTWSPADPVPGQAVTLTSTSRPSATGAAQLVATQWDFTYSPFAAFTVEGNGGSIVTRFSRAGNHVVAVKVTQSGGGFDTAVKTIPVNAPPRAAFTVAPAKLVEGREATFASTSIDPDGPIEKQEWDLNNDGRFERSGAVVSTTGLKRGTRTIRLRVTDSKGATNVSARALPVAKKPLGPPVDVKRSIGFARRSWGVELVALYIKVPRKTTVTVQCKGRGCPRGTFRKATRNKKATLRFSDLRGNVRAGAKIVIVSSHAGRISAYDTYLIRGGYLPPKLREQCRWSKTGKPRACPS